MNSKQKYDLISISHFFYPRIGGLENMAYNVIKFLSSKGLKSIAVYGNDSDRKFIADGFTQKSFNCFKLFNGTYPIFGVSFAYFIARLLLANPQALVLVYDRHLMSSVITAVICKLIGRNYVLVAQTTNSTYFKSLFFQQIGNLLEKTVFKWVVRSAYQVICVSQANRDFMIDHFGLEIDKSTIIYNGFNTGTINKFPIKDKKKQVVFATKLIPVKDPETTAQVFLELANENPDWTFLFAGSGDIFLNELEELPVNLEFRPKLIPQLQLFEILSGSAIFVNSSINEGLPVTVAEAAALGNISVLSDAPSNIEMAKVLGTTKYQFVRRDVEGLKSSLNKAMKAFESQPKLPTTMSTKARQSFAIEAVLQGYWQFVTNYQTVDLVPAEELALNYKRVRK